MMKKKALMLMAVVAVVAVTAISGCCSTCRDRQPELVAGMTAPAPGTFGFYETPAPYQLQYRNMPSERIRNFAVIEGGQQYVLTPEYPEYLSSPKDVIGRAAGSPSPSEDYARRRN